MKLVGANRHPAVSGAEELPGKVNYFLGSDPKKWRTNVPTYARVRYRGVYPGIDLVYYGNHIAKEEEDVIGAAAETLTAEDWAAVRHAVPDRADPVFGVSPEARYAELRKRLGAG